MDKTKDMIEMENKSFGLKKMMRIMALSADILENDFFRKKTEFEFADFGLQGWQRTMLNLEALEIWDATAFACTMDSVFHTKIIKDEI